MSDPLSIPRLPVNISDIVAGGKMRIQRMVGAEKDRPAEPITDTNLRDVCHQMESLFIHHLFKEMRATIPKVGFISGGRAEEIYTSMLDAELANKISTRGGIGLSEMLLHQLGMRSSQTQQAETDDDQ